MDIWVSIIGTFIGVLQGLNLYILNDIRKKQETDRVENREDHQRIYNILDTIPRTYRTATDCVTMVATCNGSRDKKLAVADKAAELITADRRKVIEDKIDGLTVSLDNLSICISKYTKGAYP